MISFLLLLVLISFKVSADESLPVYLSASVGYGFVGNPGKADPPSGSRTYSLGVNAGYQFNKYFAIDGGSVYVPSTMGDLIMMDTALRASLPLSDFASGFIHVGPGYIINTTNSSLENSFGAFIGIGGLFKINRTFSISVEDQGILPFENANAYTVNMITLGFIYGF